MTDQTAQQNGYDAHAVDPRNYETADAYAIALEQHLENCRWRWQMDQADNRGRWQMAEADAAHQWKMAKIEADAAERETAIIKRDISKFATGTLGTAWWFFLIYMSFWHWLPDMGTSIANAFRSNCLKDVAACTATVKAGEPKK